MMGRDCAAHLKNHFGPLTTARCSMRPRTTEMIIDTSAVIAMLRGEPEARPTLA